MLTERYALFDGLVHLLALIVFVSTLPCHPTELRRNGAVVPIPKAGVDAQVLGDDKLDAFRRLERVKP